MVCKMKVQVTSGGSTHVGHRRALNEDRFVASTPVFIVADGMGGHDRGDLASSMVAATFEEIATHEPIGMDQVADTVRAVHIAIRQAGQHSPPHREMGTTLVGALIVSNGASESWLIVNVGDSRAYRYFEGRLEQLSTDHSVVRELIDRGLITGADAHDHPDRHVITRAVGIQEDVVPDFLLREPQPGERLLLCSDGVTDELSDDDLAELLALDLEPQAVADRIVAAVLARDALDNITAVVIDTIASRARGELPNERTGPVPEVAATDLVADATVPLGRPRRAPS